jgi:protein phosphatase
MAVEPTRGIVIVADGMGGTPAGDVASATAVQEVIRELHDGGGVEEGIQRANARLRVMVSDEPALQGMGTTLTALVISPDTGDYVLGHVGDSRAYVFSGGEARQLSSDHTLVREMVDKGQISPEAERDHPLSHVLSRAVGTGDELVVDIEEGEAAPGDLFLLCSDGLVKVMDDDEIQDWAGRAEDSPLEVVVEDLVQEVIRRGAPDNVTVACLRILAGE